MQKHSVLELSQYGQVCHHYRLSPTSMSTPVATPVVHIPVGLIQRTDRDCGSPNGQQQGFMVMHIDYVYCMGW